MFSPQVYWSRIFIVLKKVIKALERKLSRFLWIGFNGRATGAKVNWDLMCKPKCEGGLGLRSLGEWNKDVIVGFNWSLFAQVRSLWVA